MNQELADRCLKFIEEQSCGEWGEAIENEDAAKLYAFVRTEISDAMIAARKESKPCS